MEKFINFRLFPYYSLFRYLSSRFVLVVSILTMVAIGAALISAIAGQFGEYQLASFGLKAAIGLALIIIIYIVPKLARTMRLEYLRSEYSIHIPNTGLLFCAVILIVAILALSSGNNLLYLVLAVLLSTMFISWILSRLNLGRIKVAIRYPDHIFVDEEVPFEVAVTSCKRLIPAFSIAVGMSEQNNIQGKMREAAQVAYFPIIPAKILAQMRIQRSFARRGIYPVLGFQLITRYPFGFIEQRRMIEALGEITVYPQPKPLEDFFHLNPLNNGRVESHLKGSGSDLYAIRRYLTNDHHHHIDWKATAKTTQLMVREFTRDDDWRVTIAFDPQVEDGAANGDFTEKFERAIVLAASLVNYFINQGAEVRLLTNAHDSGFGIGSQQLYSVLRKLAQLEPETYRSDSEHRLQELFSPLSAPEEQCRILITSRAPGSTYLPSPDVISIDEL
jgi:uncharacterized protein (DUF58 family)